MAKQTPKPKRDDIAVKIDREVIRIANIVAAYRGLNLNEYLSDSLGLFVRDDLKKEQAKHEAKDRKGGKP